MSSRLFIVNLVLCLGPVLPANAWAEDDVQHAVEVEQQQLLTMDTPYRQRRTLWGAQFALLTENGTFDRYLSPTSDTAAYHLKSYSEMFASPLQTMELNLGVRMNTLVGSMILSLGYGGGSVMDSKTGLLTKLAVTKKSVGVTLLLDTILPEPYVVPYAGVNMMAWDTTFTMGDNIRWVSASPAVMSMQYGVLVQLNWMDQRSMRQAHVENGLENAYLDLFMSKYPTITNEWGPNLTFTSSWGAGVRLEY